jgi:hypothetical protein
VIFFTALSAFVFIIVSSVTLLYPRPDLRIAHDRFGSSSEPSLKGHLHYPNDLDGPLDETVAEKIRQYHSDYNDRHFLQPEEFSLRNLPVVISTTGA